MVWWAPITRFVCNQEFVSDATGNAKYAHKYIIYPYAFKVPLAFSFISYIIKTIYQIIFAF